MNKEEKKIQELANWEDTTRRRKITLTNPVFIKGLALAPVVIAGTTLQNSLILCLAVILLLTPTRVITSLITRRMSVPLKTFFYPLVSAIIFGFTYYFMYKLLGTTAFSLGIYLPILIVDPLIVKNFEKTRKESVKYSIINGARNTAGFVLACLIVGSLREILAFGTIFGIKVIGVRLMPMAQYSFGGFLIVGLISAVWHAYVNIYHDKLIKEVAGYEHTA
ncbi:MAG: Rnf-Nqr domain containing protein [Oscillospiraceae bacterium]